MPMMIELFWPLSVFVVVCLVAEAVVSQLRYQWRIARLRKRRRLAREANIVSDPCRISHRWGKRFGPVDPPYSGASYSWGWKCMDCPATKSQNMSWTEREAAVHYEKMTKDRKLATTIEVKGEWTMVNPDALVNVR